MKSRTASAFVALGLSVAFVGVAAAAPSHRSAAEVPAGMTFVGNAYGTQAFVGTTVVSGMSAPVGIGCLTPAGVHYTNNVAGVNLPNVLTIGAISTTANTTASGGVIQSLTSAETAGANLLSGRITASAVKAVSATSHDSSGFHFSAAGSSLASLKIGGVPITTPPPPNTSVNLPGVGNVVLNEQIQHLRASDNASLTVNMIHVYVNVDLPGIAKGTQIIVGHATSALSLVNRNSSLGGLAFGSYARAGSTVTSGVSFPVTVGCTGTNSVITNSGAAVNIPGVASTGTVKDTAQGTVGASLSSAETSSTVQNVSLTPGLVTADAVKADAHASRSAGALSLNDAGSTFVNLKVNGQAISASVAANTKIALGNVTVWLHRVFKSAQGVEVRMIEVVANGPNPYNVATGTDVVVAGASAAVAAVTPVK